MCIFASFCSLLFKKKKEAQDEEVAVQKKRKSSPVGLKGCAQFGTALHGSVLTEVPNLEHSCVLACWPVYLRYLRTAYWATLWRHILTLWIMGCGKKKIIISTVASLSFGGLRCDYAKTTSLKKNHTPMRKVTLFISSTQNSCERTIITRDMVVSGPSGALLPSVWLRQPLENWKTLPGTFDVKTSGGFSSEPVQFWL